MVYGYFLHRKIIEPKTWNESSEVIENVHETEAGTEQISVSRYDKLKISASYQCSSKWAGIFKDFSKKDSIAVTRYDVLAGEEETRYMRMRDLKLSLVEKSTHTGGTKGLWKVSFDLEEF